MPVAKEKRAQYLETFMRLAEIGMRFLDDDACSFEPPRRRHDDDAATSGSTGVMPRSRLTATRFGF